MWAIRMADDKDRSHPRWKEIKETHEIWKDIWFGTEFGLFVGGKGSASRSRTSNSSGSKTP